jgi:HD-GYP domain-containing protein (c-di-GMP phosphodiesterase class II)
MKTDRINTERLEIAGGGEISFINSFFILFRTARLMDSNNATYVAQSSKFYVGFRKLVDKRGRISIKIIEGRIMIGDRLVKFDSDGLTRARDIMDKWRLLGIGGLILDDSLDNGQIDEFVYLIAELRQGDGGEKEREKIADKLAELGIEGIILLAIEEPTDKKLLSEDKRLMMRRTARASFFRAINVVEDIMMCAAQEKDMDINRTKRIVHSLIDRVSEDESSLIELTNIRDFDQYTYAHSVNVCVYALTLGIKLGMDKKRLSQLGFAALFHDIGKVKLPEDLIRKPDAFDENDWIQMQKHPLMGAKTILRNLKLDGHTARAALVAMEHHINSDFTGYPVLKKKRPTNLFSKIASIADTFDALSSGRVYIKKYIAPDEVLRKMMYQMKVKFDPYLIKLFVNIIGIYPPGTLVMLSSDELVVVSRTNPANLARPIVRIVGNRKGTFGNFIEADLSTEENSEKKILRIIDPQKYNIDIKSIILSDNITPISEA